VFANHVFFTEYQFIPFTTKSPYSLRERIVKALKTEIGIYSLHLNYDASAIDCGKDPQSKIRAKFAHICKSDATTNYVIFVYPFFSSRVLLN